MDNINQDMERMVAEMREVEELPAPSKGGNYNNLLRYNEMRERILKKFMSAFDAGYTLTPPNEPLTCDGCMYNHNRNGYCDYCIRRSHVSDYYRRPPEGASDQHD